MGRRRKTEAEKRDERFLVAYRIGKAKKGFDEEFICSALGVTKPTLHSRRMSPGKFKIEEFSMLGKLFDWTDEEMMSIIRP